MKHLLRFSIVSILFSIVGMAMFAQSNADHTPRDGDRLHPGMASSLSLILSVNDSTRKVLIDPSAVSFDDGCDASVYIDGDTISCVQFVTKHRFILGSDTLSYIGYENRATDFRLDRPVKVAVFPLKDGTTVMDEWRGCLVQYGSMALKHVRGSSRSYTSKGWTLTDGTDTLRNATRLVWTLDMSYADADSITAAMPDSVASEKISELQVDVKAVLSERLLSERTMWFAEDARYPVLTDSRVSRILLDDGGLPTDTVPLTMLAMHHPASWQRSDTGEDLTAMRPDGNTWGNGYAEYGFGESGPSLSVGEPEVNGGTLTVTIGSMSGPVSATITLYSDSGIRLTEPKEVSVGYVLQPYSVAVPLGWSGVVLLRIDAGEESYTRKAII